MYKKLWHGILSINSFSALDQSFALNLQNKNKENGIKINEKSSFFADDNKKTLQ